MKTCEWCAQNFNAKVTYQIYCCAECREFATKEKIAERYQINRIKNRSGKDRKCSGGCGVNISIYNNNDSIKGLLDKASRLFHNFLASVLSL